MEHSKIVEAIIFINSKIDSWYIELYVSAIVLTTLLFNIYTLDNLRNRTMTIIGNIKWLTFIVGYTNTNEK